MKGSGSTRRAASLAARQHGNVSRAQLRAAGFADDGIDRRVGHGWLIRRHRNVFAVGHVPRSQQSRWHAAVLALGDDAALSHRAAAAHWDAWQGYVPTEVTVPPHAGHRHRDGIVVHRATLTPAQLTVRNGIPVTTVLQTALDVAAVAEGRRLERVFERLQVAHELSPVEVAVAVLSRPRQRGNARLRRILDGAVDPAAVRSVLELRLLKLCAAYGIPRPLVNVPLGRWIPDFRWEGERVIVETDGARFHRTATQRRRDAAKDGELRAAGYVVIRFTWADVVQRPAQTAARIAAALAAGGATSGPRAAQ